MKPEKMIRGTTGEYGFHYCDATNAIKDDEESLPIWQDNKWFMGCEGQLSPPISYCPYCGVNLTK